MNPQGNKQSVEQIIGQDFLIQDATPRACGGTWIRGELNQHRFEALVFAEHALNSKWELGRSYISKLCVRRLPGDEMVFAWDRGDMKAAIDPLAQAIVDFLMSDKAAQAGLKCLMISVPTAGMRQPREWWKWLEKKLQLKGRR